MGAVDFQAMIATQRSKQRKDWLEETEKLLDLYYGGSAAVEVIKEYMSNIYTKPELRIPVEHHISPVNVCDRIVSELACVYEVEPDRVVSNANGETLSDDQQAEYISILDKIGWPVQMQEVERRTVLLNNCVVFLSPDTYSKTLTVELMAPAEVIVRQSDEFPSRFDRCQTIAFAVDGTAESYDGSFKSKQMVMEWDFRKPQVPLVVTIRDENGSIVGDIPGFSKITAGYPVFLARPNYPRRGEVFNDVPQDLLGISLYVAWRDAARAYITSACEMEPPIYDMQKEIFVENNGTDVMYHPSAAIFLGGPGAVSRLTWLPNAEQYELQVRNRLKRFSQSRHLPKSFAEEIVAESGVAKFWDEAPKRAYRQRMIPYWAEFEERCHSVIMQMAKQVGMDVSDALLNSTLSVTFGPLPSTMSPNEKVDYYIKQLDKNLISRDEAIAAIREIDLDEAADIAAEALTSNRSNTIVPAANPFRGGTNGG